MNGRIAELAVDSNGDVAIARLEGEIDASNAAEIGLALAEQVPSTAHGLVLDLTTTTYLDSTGVQLLFDFAAQLRSRRQTMRLVLPDDAPMRRVLELCDVASVAPIETDRNQAIERLAGGG